MLYCGIIILIFAIEIFVKDYIEHNQAYCKETKILKGKVSITKQYNTGCCMNFLENKAKLVRNISTGVLLSVILFFFWKLPRKGEHVLKLGLAFVLGGALSNIADRIYKGHVIDYLIFNVKKLKKIVFNIGDLFIFLGTILIMLHALFHKK